MCKSASAKSATAKSASPKSPPRKAGLSAIRTISLDQLVLSQANVRRIEASQSIAALAEDIAQRGLLQSLSVRAERDAGGKETGRFEVPAGGRRFRALALLAQQKRLARNAPIPCILREDGLAEEDSLAENVQREALHPLDQYRAFAALRAKGLSDEDIAARFFVTVAVVRQRLKLAAASPNLLELYADDQLSLEQLMAFCVSDDHARQEQVWEALKRGYNREPFLIRRMLTQDSVPAEDRRAVFVGVEAYQEAGGVIARDLFQQDRGGWLQDIALLERLVATKLDAEAQGVRAEGWRWVEAADEFPYGHAAGLRRIAGDAVALTAAEAESRAALQAEYDALVAAHDDADELPDDVDARLGELEQALEASDNRPLGYDPADIALAGAFVSLENDGRLRVERGFVRPQDEVRTSTGADEPDAEDGDAIVPDKAEGGPTRRDTNEDVPRPLPDRLVAELTGYRTLALRDALARNPAIAFHAALLNLCLASFHPHAAASCLEIDAKSTGVTVQAPGLAEAPPARAVEARHAEWAAQLPRDLAALWRFLRDLDPARQAALFAHCVSLTLNAVVEPWNRRSRALADADRLVEAVDLDLVAAGWEPTTANYLCRITKAQIVEAVREARGAAAAQRIEPLKKADMAAEAERLLAGSGWLPPILRRAGAEADGSDHRVSVAANPDAAEPGGGAEQADAIGATALAIAAE